MEEEEEEKEEEDEEADVTLNSNNPTLKGGEILYRNGVRGFSTFSGVGGMAAGNIWL